MRSPFVIAVLSVLLLAAVALPGPDSWKLPKPDLPSMLIAIEKSEKTYAIVMSSVIPDEMRAKDRLQPGVKNHELRSLDKCRKLIEEGEIESAEKLLGGLMRKNKANHDASALRARCQLRLGDTERALTYIRSSIIGNRRNPEAWKVLEEVAAKLGKKVVCRRLEPKGWTRPRNKEGEIEISFVDAQVDGDYPWMYYGMARAYYRHEGLFKKHFPKEKEYRLTFYEQLYAIGAAIDGADDSDAKVTKELKLLQAERKAGTIVPFTFFAIYPEPIPKKPEPKFDELLPILTKYFDEHILVAK